MASCHNRSAHSPPLVRMKTHLRTPLHFLALLVAAAAHLSAADVFPVYSPQAGLADGWKTNSWNGPVVDEIPAAAPGTTQLRVEVKPGSQPFSGVVLSCSPGSGLSLTPKLRQSGVVTIHLTSGKTALGQAAAGEQPVQLALSFLTTEGQTVHAPFKDQAAISLSPEGTKVSIAVANALKNVKTPPEQLVSISAVRIQFQGQPDSGFQIMDCTLKAE